MDMLAEDVFVLLYVQVEMAFVFTDMWVVLARVMLQAICSGLGIPT